MFSVSIPFMRRKKITLVDDRSSENHAYVLQAPQKSVHITMRRPTFVALILLQIGIIVWAAYATLFLFGDSVSAQLLAQQSDMKYEFEARISVLQSQIDSFESQAQESISPDTTRSYSVLIAKQAALETRHKFLEDVVEKTKLLGMRTSDDNMRKSEGTSSPLNPVNTQLLGQTDAASKIQHNEASLTAAFKDFEAKQQNMLAVIKTRASSASVRVRDVLTDVGLEKARDIPFELNPALPTGEKVTFENQLTKTRRVLSAFEQFQTIFNSMPLLPPVGESVRMSSQFGPRKHPLLGIQRLHAGLDYAAPEGHPIYAPASGTVVFVGKKGGYGNVIELSHGFGVITRYAHLSEMHVSQGQRVAPKTLIGAIGTTGLSTGPHLHYETRVEGQPQDPLKFITAHKRL